MFGRHIQWIRRSCSLFHGSRQWHVCWLPSDTGSPYPSPRSHVWEQRNSFVECIEWTGEQETSGTELSKTHVAFVNMFLYCVSNEFFGSPNRRDCLKVDHDLHLHDSMQA